MQWAIVNLVDMEIPNPNGDGTMINAPAGTCVNIIVYDGSSPYNPGDNLELKSVDDAVMIGDYVGV